MPIGPGTVTVLREWRRAQLAERLAWGPAWTESGRVFTREDGTPVRPGWISQRFGAGHTHHRYGKAHGLSPNFYWSPVRGPYASVRLPGGFRIGHRL